MRLLVDTHVLLGLLGQVPSRLPVSCVGALEDEEALRLISVASLWEIAIKHRQGKLTITFPLEQLPQRSERVGFRIIDITSEQALHRVEPLPATADPFDRLLLAVAAVEGARLLTIDRKLVDHPLAWRPASA